MDTSLDIAADRYPGTACMDPKASRSGKDNRTLDPHPAATTPSRAYRRNIADPIGPGKLNFA